MLIGIKKRKILINKKNIKRKKGQTKKITNKIYEEKVDKKEKKVEEREKLKISLTQQFISSNSTLIQRKS